MTVQYVVCRDVCTGHVAAALLPIAATYIVNCVQLPRQVVRGYVKSVKVQAQFVCVRTANTLAQYEKRLDCVYRVKLMLNSTAAKSSKHPV